MELIIVNQELKKEWMEYSNWSDAINEEVIHIDDGVSIIAKIDEELAGIISIRYNEVNEDFKEVYIDNIEVREIYRKKGIATALINEIIKKIRNKDFYQIRAWSTLDKKAMIKLWIKLGFTLCPATVKPHGREIKGYFASKIL